MARSVSFHPLAEADLLGVYDYIEHHAGPAVAGRYVERLQALCAGLATMPERGVPRADLGIGIRTVSMERRVLVVYRNGIEAVVILRVLYAGRDFGADDLPPSF